MSKPPTPQHQEGVKADFKVLPQHSPRQIRPELQVEIAQVINSILNKYGFSLFFGVQLKKCRTKDNHRGRRCPTEQTSFFP